ncbi:MAG TPA: efflux RND transporter periplasmic adaptor subunit [Gemmatimonadaceae bacterium]|nr:efflux RND transporter periplasmic adaptor subunit [Gemmatimonadaceae bacterium]
MEIARAELGTAARTVTATGTVEPIRTVGVNSQLAGALLTVNVEEGDIVRAGTVLARIDSRELEAQLKSAEAALVVAQSASDRARQLREQQIVTVAEYERDQAAYAAALATRDQLRTRLGYATVRSPIAGVVLQKHVERGDIVGAQTPLFSIADISTLVVRVPVSELDVTALENGDRVDVAVDALPGRVLEGRIRRVFPSADTLTRLVPVEVALGEASAREVRPGFLARVAFALAPRTGVLMVPGAALLEDATGAAVYVVSGNHASRRRVRRGDTYQGRVEVLEGLEAGDSVVVAGNNMLRDGSEVRVVSAPSSDTTPPVINPGTARDQDAAPARTTGARL